MTGKNFDQGWTRSDFDDVTGSFVDDVIESASNVEYRLVTNIENIRSKIDRAIKSVEEDIYEANINRIVLALSNGLAGTNVSLAGMLGLIYFLQGRYCTNYFIGS